MFQRGQPPRHENSALRNSLSGALSCASTALKALIGVDLVVKLAHIDRFSRALSCARAAGQALIRNNVCHDITSI